MKQIVITLIIGFLSYSGFAQAINQFDADGKRHGVWKKNFEGTNQMRYHGQFEHGKEVGEFRFYKYIKKKSLLTATKQFNSSDNSAMVKFLASNGKVISEGKMRGKLYIGKWNYYHNKSDVVMTLENYDNNGLLQGERFIYYKDGQIAEKANYETGKLQGRSIWYSLKNVVLKSFIYDNDELHGIAKYYNGKGELLAEGQYKRGKKAGIWSYYEDGKIKEKKDFSAKPKSKPKQ
mgnify:CR=1 FL=1